MWPRSIGLLSLMTALLVGPVPELQAPNGRDRPIARISHDGISFSVSIDQNNDRFLAVGVSEKQTTAIVRGPRQPVKIRIRYRDETAIDGTPQLRPSVSNGGYTDWKYQFDAKRSLTIGSIFSVTIWIGDQVFELFPW